MTNTYYVGQDDNNWVLDIFCSDVNGAVELGAATEILLYLGRTDTTSAIDGLVCTAVADYAFSGNPGTSGKNAIARYIGTAQVASQVATYNARVQVTWGDGTVRSFPTTKQYPVVNVTGRP